MDIKQFFSYSTQFKNEENIILRDYLAMERTKLANERTLLSYIRSSLYLLVGGIALIQLEGFEAIHYLGYVALFLTVLFLVIGVIRFRRLNQKLKTYYEQANSVPLKT